MKKNTDAWKNWRDKWQLFLSNYTVIPPITSLHSIIALKRHDYPSIESSLVILCLIFGWDSYVSKKNWEYLNVYFSNKNLNENLSIANKGW